MMEEIKILTLKGWVLKKPRQTLVQRLLALGNFSLSIIKGVRQMPDQARFASYFDDLNTTRLGWRLWQKIGNYLIIIRVMTTKPRRFTDSI